MGGNTRLAGERFSPDEELRAFSDGTNGAGAVASFTGIARSTSKRGEAVAGLFLDHHERLTLASMETIGASAFARFEVTHWRIVHRCGYVAAGEPIVFVSAASAHRRAALEAVDYMMDRLKTDAMFWKREDAASGPQWIEPTAEDYAARDKW